MEITINKIEPYKCEAFSPNGISLGFLNEYEFNDLRIQIKTNKVEGYYMRPKEGGELCFIDSDGRIDYWPEGFYDLIENQLMHLL